MTYAGKVAVRRAKEAAEAFGLDVAGVELAPDGPIRVLDARAMPTPADLFEKLEAEGGL